MKKQFEKMILSGMIPVFEIEVEDKRSNKLEWILFHISIDGNLLKAKHEPLTEKEKNSDKIAFESVEIDEERNLDSHLAELFCECNEAIRESDFYMFS